MQSVIQNKLVANSTAVKITLQQQQQQQQQLAMASISAIFGTSVSSL